MKPEQLNRAIASELQAITNLALITEDERRRITAGYPTTPWNILSLVRWFTILGAVSSGAGLLLLVRHLGAPLRLAELGLGLSFVGLLSGGLYLDRNKQLHKTGAALQLGASFALQGLSVVLAMDFSSGSKNWPALIGVDALLIALLAYAVRNRLVLIHALVNAFTYFGGETGYMSGWGAYWLGMTYPARFFAVGWVALGGAWLHARELRGALQAFSRVYLHFGLLSIQLSLWFLSVFGWFDDLDNWDGSAPTRLLFTVLWAGFSIGCIVYAGSLGQRALRAYGLTFLTINAYTFYFQFVVANSGSLWFFHMLVTGGSLIALGAWASRNLRPNDATA
jgi:hypothetical protein